MNNTNSGTLKDHILASITTKGSAIPFHEFMSMALYTPELGFYTHPHMKVGREGHFTTAPEISPLFAQCIASQIAPYLKSKRLTHIIEFGGGSGQLGLQLLLQLETLNALPEQYLFLDLSPSLKHQQQDNINSHAPHLASRCQWLNTLPQDPINAIVLANEVLDAMPVHRFAIQEQTITEIHVDRRDNALIEVLMPPSKRLEDRLAHLPPLPEGYQSEVNLFIKPWLQSLHDVLESGLVYLFDYGFPAKEYYHPDRHQGTLMCHYQHKAHTNPYIHIGEQDITAHVDFTWLAESADDIGFSIKGYTNQASFLLANGITERIDDRNDETLFRDNQAVKTLTLPHEMGELFKVMAIGKNMPDPLVDFALVDFRRHLS